MTKYFVLFLFLFVLISLSLYSQNKRTLGKSYSDRITFIFKDSLTNYCDYFNEEEGEKECEANFGYKTSNEKYSDINDAENKFMLELLLQNHYSYRTRDDGIRQKAIGTTFYYEHSSGFGALTGLNLVSNVPKVLDEIDLGIYYDFEASAYFTGTVLYTHFFFQDSSKSAKSVFKNSLENDLSLDLKKVIFSASLLFDFSGSSSEITLILNPVLPLLLSKNFLKGKLTFEPGINAYYGQQNSELTVLKKGKGNVNVPKISNKNVFGVLGYEFDFPLNLETNYISFRPDVTVVYPLNVLDQSSKTPFVNVSLNFVLQLGF